MPPSPQFSYTQSAFLPSFRDLTCRFVLLFSSSLRQISQLHYCDGSEKMLWMNSEAWWAWMKNCHKLSKKLPKNQLRNSWTAKNWVRNWQKLKEKLPKTELETDKNWIRNGQKLSEKLNIFVENKKMPYYADNINSTSSSNCSNSSNSSNCSDSNSCSNCSNRSNMIW